MEKMLILLKTFNCLNTWCNFRKKYLFLQNVVNGIAYA